MEQPGADLIFFGGEIVTMEKDCPTVEAVAVKGKKIIAVGAKEDVLKLHQSSATELVDLRNRVLLPGFVASHSHPFLTTQLRYFTDISGFTHFTAEQVFETMQRVARNTSNEDDWVVFYGYDQCLLPNLPELTSSYLDANVSAVNPVVVISMDIDNAWFNHKALENAGINESNVPDLGPGRIFSIDASGKLSGRLRDPPMFFLLKIIHPHPSVEEKRRLFREHFKEFASRGFTTVVDLGSNDEDTIKLGLEVASENECPVRLCRYAVSSLATASDEDSHSMPSCDANLNLWVAGVKFWADGEPHSGTMAVKEKYLETDVTAKFFGNSFGQLNYDSDDLCKKMEKFHRNGWQISTHTQGDHAIEQVLEIYESLLSKWPRQDHRYRLEHVGLITPDQLDKVSKLGVTPSFLVDELFYYGKILKEKIIGKERAEKLVPLASAKAKQICFSIHEDCPLFPLTHEPFRSMKTAVTRKTRDEDGGEVLGGHFGISIQDSLEAYTINAAWQIFCENSIGSLKVGKLADLVILSHNPLKVPAEHLESIEIVATYMNGIATHTLSQ